MQIVLLITQLILFIYVIILYGNTKHYSLRYKDSSRIIGRTFTVINFIAFFITLLTLQYGRFGILIWISLGLYLFYAIMKLYLRSAQTLADINWRTGSSLLKEKFSLRSIDWKFILLVNVGLALWTCLVFTINKPVLNENLLGPSPILFTNDSESLATYLSVFFLAPVMEELIYRFLYLQVFLYWARKITKCNYVHWIAIILPTILWVILHNNGLLVNYWIKYIQILPLGIVCAYTSYKKDIEHSILIHIVFNIIGAILTLTFSTVWFG